MSKLEKALTILNSLDVSEPELKVSPVALTITILLFLAFMLSAPMFNLGMMLWFGVWLALVSPWLGVSFESLLKPSVVVLPFIAMIGIFNPLIDREPLLRIGSLTVSKGWITFAVILVRGLLAVSATILLIRVCGFRGFCHSLRHLRIPSFLVTQLLMVFRYLKVLLEEALTMKRARHSRGYGKHSLPLSEWGRFVGSLFFRSLDRSERIHNAMLCRGFKGEMPDYFLVFHKWRKIDTLFLLFSSVWFAAVRFFC